MESAILLATRIPAPPDHKLRVILLEDESAAAATITGDRNIHVPPRERLLAAMALRADGKPGRANGILVHDLKQADLRSTKPWPIKHAPRDTATRVVAHLQKALDQPRNPVERLAERWAVSQGIQTGADAYTARIQKRLSSQIKAELAGRGLKTGDPILERPAGTENRAPWRDHPAVLARSPEPRALLYAAIDAQDSTSLVWLRGTDDPPAPVLEALEPWRDVLRTRAEFVRNSRRKWWETAWPRDEAVLRGPKVIALYRTDRGRFALDEQGSWQPSIKTTIAAPREEGLSVAYLCGVLNSELLDLWYAVRGKTPWHNRRNYEPKPMNEMPYRHVATPEDWEPGEAISQLTASLENNDVERVVEIAASIRAAKGTPHGDRDAQAAIEALVRAIARNRQELLPLRSVAPELSRAVKNPWRTHGVGVDIVGVLAQLPKEHVRSVRLDPSLDLDIHTDGVLGKVRRCSDSLEFHHSRKLTATVTGPSERLDLLERTMPTSRRLMPDDLRTAVLPADIDAFVAEVGRRQDEIDNLLSQGRAYVEAVERIVCALYGLSDALTDQVVESAVSRSGQVGEEDD